MPQNADTTNTLDPILNPASVYYLHPSESGHKLVIEVFGGSAYGDWKRAMVIALSGRNKLAFVDGTLSKPNSTTHVAESKAWERVNNVVIGWILAALEHQIARSVLWFKTTRKIWSNLYNSIVCFARRVKQYISRF